MIGAFKRLTGSLLVAAVPACEAGPPAKKLLLVGLDGVRVDVLAAAQTPHIDSLIELGTFSSTAYTRPPTVSGPGWSSMLTGVWSDKHLVVGNDFTGNAYERYPDFLTRLEMLDPEWSTLAVLDWPPLATTASGGPMISDMVDTKLLIDGDEIGYGVADSLSVDAAVEQLLNRDVDAAFVYLGDIDVVGHDFGTLSHEYRHAIETADRHVGRLIAAVRGRSSYEAEDWLIIVATDHGRTDSGGHGGASLQETTVFILVSGSSAARGTTAAPGIVDVAATGLTHLGVEIRSAWGLDGRPIGLRERY